jgi:hypothetical protein
LIDFKERKDLAFIGGTENATEYIQVGVDSELTPMQTLVE